MNTWIVLLLLLAAAVIFGVSVYNNLIRHRNDVAKQFAEIDVILTQRYDLIPNLVAVAKKYMEHEQETLVKVTEARNIASSALKKSSQQQASEAVVDLSKAEKSLSESLGTMYVVFEDYPELQADKQMLQLQNDIADTENRVSFARSIYNDSVTRYNNLVQTFPNNLFNIIFGFKGAQWLEIENEEKRQAVKVDFD